MFRIEASRRWILWARNAVKAGARAAHRSSRDPAGFRPQCTPQSLQGFADNRMEDWNTGVWKAVQPFAPLPDAAVGPELASPAGTWRPSRNFQEVCAAHCGLHRFLAPAHVWLARGSRAATPWSAVHIHRASRVPAGEACGPCLAGQGCWGAPPHWIAYGSDAVVGQGTSSHCVTMGDRPCSRIFLGRRREIGCR